ncbi:20216_t:CDS:2 [Entrophospora sp. SA101]|nr:20216_t:CDS:2 [Entrophospora sp. SA101]
MSYVTTELISENQEEPNTFQEAEELEVDTELISEELLLTSLSESSFEDDMEEELLIDETLSPLEKISLYVRSELAFHSILVSPADCRMMAFPTIDESIELWIKGQQFSIQRLLGDESAAKEFEGGSLGIFRLAPQDYHRFHFPVDGRIGENKPIAGDYYTVNPMAIRSE